MDLIAEGPSGQSSDDDVIILEEPTRQEACESCTICTGDYTLKSKKKLECPYCKAHSCLSCLKQCSLMWAAGPKCPHCNKAFTTEFIDTSFPKGFRRGRLRIAAVQNLQEQEMSLLPETMIALERLIKRNKFNKAHSELKTIFETILRYPCTEPWPLEQIANLEKELRAQNTEITKKKREAIQRTLKCPLESCNGFIAGSTCALCQTKVCRECNSVSGEDHVCSQDAVESWKLIRDTTVQCPKCFTHIHRISGCNQMWCTVKDCNTAFDWQTGKIINGPLHNPHYHEYLRLAGAAGVQGGPGQAPALADLACLTPIQIMSNVRVAQIYGAYRIAFKDARPGSIERLAMEYLRAMTEIFDYFPEPEAYTPRTYEKIRMEYLQGLITKKRWASKMSHRETLRTKKMRIWSLRTMYQNTAADIFSHLLHESVIKMNPSLDSLERFVKSHETLRLYYAKEMQVILSDFSDTRAKILVKLDNGSIQWQLVDLN